jgi:hypothetical protein
MPKVTFMLLNEKIAKIALEPTPISAQIPEWYKHQPSMMEGVTKPTLGQYPLTVKKCQAIFDAMTSGYVLKTPCDIFIDTTSDPIDVQVPQNLRFVQHVLLSAHAEPQVSHMPIDNDLYINHILRIHPLWLVGTEPGYSTLFLDPMHSEVSGIAAVPGIIDTDKFYADGHLSFYVKKGFVGTIKKGTPMVQVIPFKRENWTHEIVDTDSDFIDEQRAVIRSTFKNGYRINCWEKKNYK